MYHIPNKGPYLEPHHKKDRRVESQIRGPYFKPMINSGPCGASYGLLWGLIVDLLSQLIIQVDYSIEPLYAPISISPLKDPFTGNLGLSHGRPRKLAGQPSRRATAGSAGRKRQRYPA